MRLKSCSPIPNDKYVYYALGGEIFLEIPGYIASLILIESASKRQAYLASTFL